MALMRWQIQMPKLIKNSNVYLPGKSETHYISIAYITMKQEPGRVAQSVTCLGYRCMFDCRSRGREFDPGPVPYFRGD